MEKSKHLKNCAKCGRSFECLHSKDCWCTAFQISEQNLKLLRETYDNCLCPECLRAYAENPSEIIDM